jgi:hypothetical protein
VIGLIRRFDIANSYLGHLHEAREQTAEGSVGSED